MQTNLVSEQVEDNGEDQAEPEDQEQAEEEEEEEAEAEPEEEEEDDLESAASQIVEQKAVSTDGTASYPYFTTLKDHIGQDSPVALGNAFVDDDNKSLPDVDLQGSFAVPMLPQTQALVLSVSSPAKSPKVQPSKKRLGTPSNNQTKKAKR